MSERLGSKPAPSAEDYLVPLEPYYDSLLQFRVLQAMGYPVRVEELDATEIGDDIWPGDEYFQWQRQTYPYWAKLVVTNSDFEENWIETCDCPGDRAVVDVGYQDLVYNHPIRLLYEVGTADYSMLSYYLEQLKGSGEIEGFKMRDNGLVTPEFLERCFMAAIERAQHRLRSNYPDTYPDDVPELEDMEVYEELARQGQEAAKSEELMAVIWDYYAMLEEISPEFAAFKKLG